MENINAGTVLASLAKLSLVFKDLAVTAELIQVERNEFQDNLAAHAFLQDTGRFPQTKEELELGYVTVNRMQENVRRHIEAQLSDYEKKQEVQKKRDLVAKHKEAQKPHSLGTVAEIAARYNISKSEVRRRKADGTLEDHLTELTGHRLGNKGDL